MAANPRGRGMQGVTKLRRKLRRMQEQVDQNIRPVVDKGSQAILADMKSLTPRATGRAVEAMDYNLSRDGMSSQIGIRTKGRAKKAFHFRFLDQGTKGSPSHNIPPMPALHIRERAFDAHRGQMKDDIARAISKTLSEAAGG